jgi:hypothetical protein
VQSLSRHAGCSRGARVCRHIGRPLPLFCSTARVTGPTSRLAVASSRQAGITSRFTGCEMPTALSMLDHAAPVNHYDRRGSAGRLPDRFANRETLTIRRDIESVLHG